VELWLVRHALPLRRETSDGSPADPPLSEAGLEQARRLDRWLADLEVDDLYVSPLRRARETAAPYAERRGLALVAEPGVAEFDQHSSVYVPLEELKRTDYEAWQALVQNGYGADAEFDAFVDAVIGSLTRIVEASPRRRVVVVCHGGVINIWAAHVLGMSPRLFFAPDYTSVSRFLCASSGERSIVSLNETPHLERGD